MSLSLIYLTAFSEAMDVSEMCGMWMPHSLQLLNSRRAGEGVRGAQTYQPSRPLARVLPRCATLEAFHFSLMRI